MSTPRLLFFTLLILCRALCAQTCGSTTPSLRFTYVAPYGGGTSGGTSSGVEGVACGIQSDKHGIVVFIFVIDAWWVKPYFNAPVTPIASDGTWVTGIYTGGSDLFATQIAAFVIPNSYSVAITGPYATLPPDITSRAVASAQTTRSQNSITGTIVESSFWGLHRLSGVKIILTGADNGTTQTAQDGEYSFVNSITAGGPNTITPSDPNYSFSPPTITIPASPGNHVADFTATPIGPSINAVVNAASYSDSNGTPVPTGGFGFVAPGEIVVIFGSGLGPSQLAQFQVNSLGNIDTQLAGTSIFFNGTLAPIIYTSAKQVAASVPYTLSGTNAQITVTYQGRSSHPASMNVAPSAPGIFSLDASGSGQAAAVNQDGSVNGGDHPAPVGSIISFYATGEGQTSPSGVDGKLAQSPLPHPLLPVTVTFGSPGRVTPSHTVTPQYVGGAPGTVAGVMQINVQIPSGIQTGNAVPVVVQVGGVSSQPGVTIAVR